MTVWTETQITAMPRPSVPRQAKSSKGAAVFAIAGHSEKSREPGWFQSLAKNVVAEVPADAAGDAHVEAGQADELFRNAYPRLAGWVRRLVDDDDTAHEIASEAFVRLLSRWTQVENPQSYLYMIATNLVRDHWRKTERERRAMSVVTATATADPVTHPVQDVEVRNLIGSLQPRLREPFLLHYYGGFAIKEVAELLHKSPGTIKSDLSEARAKLKTALS